jgi:Family of unknown function (DUF6519)
MKGDFTRFTFDAEKRYRNVLTQQGRVTVDADPNEQQFITSHRIETEAADLIGGCGAPLHDAGFKITPAGANLTIGAGRFYVDGILCENRTNNLSINSQPDLPTDGVVVLADGSSVPISDAQVTPGVYHAYLDVWLRHVTAIEDGSIREIALGGPDTATRVKTTWQVRLFRLGNLGASFNCLSQSEAFNNLKQGATGKMRARAQTGAADDKPCVVPPGAGFRRLENQLYHVEVHKGGALGAATFKWSRDNGSVVTNWKSASPNPTTPATHLDLVVGSIGRDKVLRFAGGQWVELTDDTREETGRAGLFAQVVKAEGEIVTIDTTTAFPPGPINIANFTKNPKVRRWDFRDKPADMKIVQPAAPNDWLKLEDGLEVRFEPGNYRAGDYWLIPARTVEPFIEWPKDALNQAAALPPHGIEHHYCRLAVVTLNAAKQWVDVRDCRKLFPPVTELTSMFYVSGEGQEVTPNLTIIPNLTGLPPEQFHKLAQPLKVGVANGQWPVQGAKVRFELVTPNSGRLNGIGNVVEVDTLVDGIATCEWELRWAVPTNPPTVPALLPSQQVKATLLKADGQPSVHLPVIFTANLSVASLVAYNPAACPDLTAAKAITVQAAIDELCKRKPGGGCSVTVGPTGQFPTLNEAVKALLAEGRRELCICLLPGSHGLTENLGIIGKGEITLKLEGCGRGSRLLGQKFGMAFSGLAGVTLAGIDFDLRENENPLQIRDCQHVTITDCDVVGSGNNGTLLMLEEAGRVWIENSMLANYETTRFTLHRNILNNTPFTPLFETVNQRAFERDLSEITAKTATTPASKRQEIAASIKGKADGAPELGPEERGAYNLLIQTLNAAVLPVNRLASNLLLLRRGLINASNARAIVIINPRNDVSLADNTVLGLLSLYGPGGRNQLTLEMLRQMMNGGFKTRALFNTTEHTLSLRNNHLSRLALADKFIDFLMEVFKPANGASPAVEIENVFTWLALTDNLFDSGGAQMLGRHCSLSTNRLNDTIAISPDLAPSFGVALGETGTYLANSSVLSTTLDVLHKQPAQIGANINVRINGL